MGSAQTDMHKQGFDYNFEYEKKRREAIAEGAKLGREKLATKFRQDEQIRLQGITPNEYQKLAERTECDQNKSLDRMYNYKAVRLNHAVLGLSGEIGELAAAVERWIYYGQTLDQINIQEELGDCLWYIAEACNDLGINMSDLMTSNIAKLKQRYPEKFDSTKALEENRDREAEAKAIKHTGTKKVCPTYCLGCNATYGSADCRECSDYPENQEEQAKTQVRGEAIEALDGDDPWQPPEDNKEEDDTPEPCKGCKYLVSDVLGTFNVATCTALQRENQQCGISPPNQSQALPIHENTEVNCAGCEGERMEPPPILNTGQCIEKDPVGIQPPSESYQELCSLCERIRLHKHNKSGLCPDCAADVRTVLNRRVTL